MSVLFSIPAPPPPLKITTSYEEENAFFVHANLESNRITAINSNPNNIEGEVTLPISISQAKDFLSGKENSRKWLVKEVDGEFKLIKRTDVLRSIRKPSTLVEITGKSGHHYDIHVKLNSKENQILVYVNGESIYNWKNNVNLFFTEKGNPYAVKQCLRLSADIMNQIAKDNRKKRWINPLVISISNLDDTSLYVINTDAAIWMTHD